MSARYANDLTEIELKEELRKLGLSGTGYKNELIARLNESTSGGMWIEQQSEVQAIEDTEEAASERSIHERPECDQEGATIEIRLESQVQDIRILEMELGME